MVLGGGGGASGEYKSLQERAIHVIMILTMGYGPLGSVAIRSHAAHIVQWRLCTVCMPIYGIYGNIIMA